ncbi:MAG: hypothetical protein KDB84_01670, partial [Flavobacteriales bacterium]|nr:hypothetical protein [Flavobacteriales bacterium]
MRILFILPAAVLSMACVAQVAHGGRPAEWDMALDRSTVPAIGLPPLEASTLIASEEGHQAGVKYGVQRVVPVDVIDNGDWTELPNGERLCRLMLRSPGAAMLSVQFDQWELPVGAMVYLYNEDRNFFIGGFNAENRGPDGTMATAVVPGDALLIEYRLPQNAGFGSLHVSSITHGYRDVFHFGEKGMLRDYWPGYSSLPCNINVACAQASAWQQQKKSVVMFLRPDGGGCTGTLVNTVHAPGRPMVHIANHCYVPTESQYVFYFNYEAPACVGDTGQTLQTLTGATYVANLFDDDFALLRMTTPPQNAGYDVYYAGWDRSGATPQSAAVIHHPAYDVKKFTFDQNASTSYVADGLQLWRCFWDQGIVEGVSSGAPMFDQNKRMVGHMNEGSQNCSNSATVYTGCAKFSASWDGVTPQTRLRDWLDSANTGVTQLNGFAPGVVLPDVKVRLRAFLEGPFNSGNGLMNATLRANGSIPLTEPYTGLGYAHVGGGGETTAQSVLNVSNSNAIVDWVVVELRNKNNSAQVLATRSALLQRDGDIVATDGTSDVSFAVAADQYFIAVRHRNHLGIMTGGSIALSATASLVDLGNAAVPLFGGANATKTIASERVMFAGDVVANSTLAYTGTGNDRDPVLQRIGGTVPTATVQGYFVEDINMDGTVQYTGTNN